MGLLLRPGSAWGACGMADLGARTADRKQRVTPTLLLCLLSYRASLGQGKQGFPIAYISVQAFLKPILITESTS